jgi:ABC-type multidrug transport system fused ATPase/permease subunit
MTPLQFFVRVIRQFYRKNKALTAVSFILACAVPATNVFVSKAFTGLIECIQDKKNISKYMLYFVTALAFSRICYMIMERIHVKLLPRFQVFLRSDTIAHVFTHLHDIHDHADIGDILSKLSKLPWAMEMYFNAFKDRIIPLMSLLIIIGVIATTYDIYIGIGCILIAFIFLFGVVIRGPEVCAKISLERDREHNKVYSYLEDILRNLSAVYVEKQSHTELNKLNVIQTKYVQGFQSTYDCYAPIHIWMSCVALGIMLLMVGGSFIEVKKGTMSGSTFAFFSILAINLMYFLFNTTESIRELTFQYGILDSILQFMGKSDRTATQTNKTTDTNVAVKLDSVSYTVNNKQILKPINATIPIHKVTLINGQNGTGKTTLLKVLAGFYTGYSGTMQVAPQYQKNYVAYMPQNPTLFSRTLYDNLVYGHETPKSREELAGIITKYNLQNLIPISRLDQNVGRLGANMSGGQKAWTYFMRLFTNPEKQVYLLDEPTSWMDKTTRPIFYKLIGELAQTKTVVMVTHDEELKKLATNVINL